MFLIVIHNLLIKLNEVLTNGIEWINLIFWLTKYCWNSKDLITLSLSNLSMLIFSFLRCLLNDLISSVVVFFQDFKYLLVIVLVLFSMYISSL